MKKFIIVFLFFFSILGYSQINHCDIYYVPNNQNNEENVDVKTKTYESYELRINRFHRNHLNWSYWQHVNFYYTLNYWYFYPYFHYSYFYPPFHHHLYWYNHFFLTWNYRYVWGYRNTWFWSPYTYNRFYGQGNMGSVVNDNVYYGPRHGGGNTTGNIINESNDENRRYRRPERTIEDYNERSNYSSRNQEENRKGFDTTPRIYRDERNIRRSDDKRSSSPIERNVRGSSQNQRNNTNINRQPNRTTRTPSSVNRSTPPTNRGGTSSSSKSSSTRRRN